MKKLFSYLMVAAAALVVACGPAEEPDGPKPEKQFYGFEANGADIAVIGNNEYIIQMFEQDEETGITRLYSADVFIPGIGEDGVIPAGIYKLVNGEPGDTGMYVKGSFFQNFIAETPYMIAINSGELEVKHTAEGYVLTIYTSGGQNVTSEAGETMTGIGFRYKGDLMFYEPKLTPVPEADAAYYGEMVDQDGKPTGTHQWAVQILVQEPYNGYYQLANLYICTDSADWEAGIPSGTYPINFTYSPGSAIAYYENGSGILLVNPQSFKIEGYGDVMFGGEVEIVNNGDGTYKIDILYYNKFYLPYNISFNGKINLSNQSEAEQLTFEPETAKLIWLGDGLWVVTVADTKFTYEGENYGCAIDLYCVNDAETASFEAGLATGKYTVAVTELSPFTFIPTMEQNGSPIGSMIYMTNADYLYDYILDGELNVTNNGDGTYKLEFVKIGGEDFVFSGTYEGAVTAEDESKEETATPAARVKAPFKNTTKKITLGEGNYDFNYRRVK